jgi:hypothetical protein
MKGILNTDLIVVPCNEITAVAGDFVKTSLITDRSGALEFAAVVEKLNQHFTLLPMRFGSVMESTDLISQMLERNYVEIQQNLYKVEDKYEFGLKLFCDSKKLADELMSKSAELNLQSLQPDAGTEKSVFRDYVDKKLKEHRLEELMLAYVDSVISEITRCLSKFDAIRKFRKMVSETTILDAIFLVQKVHKEAIILAIEDLQNQYPVLNFVLTGPWPPYNFVEITLT